MVLEGRMIEKIFCLASRWYIVLSNLLKLSLLARWVVPSRWLGYNIPLAKQGGPEITVLNMLLALVCTLCILRPYT